MLLGGLLCESREARPSRVCVLARLMLPVREYFRKERVLFQIPSRRTKFTSQTIHLDLPGASAAPPLIGTLGESGSFWESPRIVVEPS